MLPTVQPSVAQASSLCALQWFAVHVAVEVDKDPALQVGWALSMKLRSQVRSQLAPFAMVPPPPEGQAAPNWPLTGAVTTVLSHGFPVHVAVVVESWVPVHIGWLLSV